MNFTRLNDELAVALTWLTRLPVQFPANAPTLASAAWAFPVVGAIVGAIAALVFLLAEWAGAPALLAGVLAVAAMTLVTGGLHEDGLADFFDGLGARGGKTEKLAAMRDSHIGVYGVLSLIISFAARATALASADVAFALIVICALSRTAMVQTMRELPPARVDGSGHAAGIPESSGGRLTVLIAVALAGVWMFTGSAGLTAVGLILAAGFLAMVLVVRKARRTLGGFTGDVLGAICLTSETVMLIAAAILLA
jgi:adenosylcobinamide-GDP ribazoletransferase